MAERLTQSPVEQRLVAGIDSMIAHAGQDDTLTHLLRELKLIISSPTRGASGLIACSGAILAHLDKYGGEHPEHERYIEFAEILKASRHQWNTRREARKSQGNDSESEETILVDPIQQSDVDNNVTRINYPVQPATYRLLQDARFLYRLSNMLEDTQDTHQSILALMKSSSSRVAGTQTTVGDSNQESTEKLIQWDQMKENFSHDSPKEQIDQLKVLYKVLSEATGRFFPPNHPLQAVFKCPLAPTTLPSHTAAQDMRSLVIGLRERCAPVRDGALINIEEILSSDPGSKIVEAAQAIVRVAELMRNDLNDYVLQNASEDDARHWVRVQARSKEREAVSSMVGDQENLEQAWNAYLSVETGVVSKGLLAHRLLQTISASNAAIFLPLDMRSQALPDQNLVPPQLMLSVDAIIKAQDLLQAVVVVASLRSIIPSAYNLAEPFMARLWTLVESATLGSKLLSEPQLKLVNIQDEVIQIYHTFYASQPETQLPIPDATLRASVSRTLRTEDPAFRLLQKRLVSALEVQLLQTATEPTLPLVMRSGRQVGVFSESTSNKRDGIRVRAKGFEDSVLDKPILRLFQSVKQIVEWVAFCWDDFVSKG